MRVARDVLWLHHLTLVLPRGAYVLPPALHGALQRRGHTGQVQICGGLEVTLVYWVRGLE